MNLKCGVYFVMCALVLTTVSSTAQSAKRSVLTGGPGVGKSTLIKELASRGYQTVPEIYAVLYEQAVQNNALEAFFADPVKLYDDLLNEQLRWESVLDDQVPAFLDRGTIDIIAFGQFFKVPLSHEFKARATQLHYDLIFFLEPLPVDLYTTSHRRKEAFQEAAELHMLIKNAYIQNGYTQAQLIDVPFGTVDQRVELIVSKIVE